MIIYNVTTKVEPAIANAWLRWLKDEHIPDLVKTGCFTHAVILQLTDVDDSDGPTFAVQYHAPDREAFDRYIDQHADEMRQRTTAIWGNKCISFRTIMQVVD